MTGQHGKIHVAANKRGFGLGFGANHQVVFYTEDGPKTGALLTGDQCDTIGQWAAAGNDQRVITDFIPPKELAHALHNRLLHADTIELTRILPKMLSAMSEDDRRLMLGGLKGVPPGMWKEIAETRPQLLAQGFNPGQPEHYFNPILQGGDGVKISDSGEDMQFNGISMEALAAVLPILFEAQDKDSRIALTSAIAGALRAAGEDKSFFQPLADLNLNRLVITDDSAGACQDIINNGRTIMIRSANGPKVRFQGEDFTSSNLHFHPLKNAAPSDGPVMNMEGHEDAKPEFLRYRSAAHEARCRQQPRLDPNRKSVGQLHAIFTANGKRALLLGADVTLGEANPGIGKYIDFLKAKKAGQALEIINDTGDAAEVASKAVMAGELAFTPLACFHGRFDADGVPEAPFMSLHLGGLKVNAADDIGLKEGKSDVFYRGVRVIHLSEPITISTEQLKALRELQPVLKSVDEDTCVHPHARFQPAPQRLKDKSSDITPGL